MEAEMNSEMAYWNLLCDIINIVFVIQYRAIHFPETRSFDIVRIIYKFQGNCSMICFNGWDYRLF